MFRPCFEAPILAGTKRQTIRPRGRRPEPGEKRSLRVWTDKPYRSPQREFAQVTLTEVNEVTITEDGPVLDGIQLNSREADQFAVDDGFKDWPTMRTWFNETHKALPFDGYLLRWEPLEWACDVCEEAATNPKEAERCHNCGAGKP